MLKRFTRKGMRTMAFVLLAALALCSCSAGVDTEPEYIGALKAVLMNERDYRYVWANEHTDYNDTERRYFIGDIQDLYSYPAVAGVHPERMTVLDLDMDGNVEVVLELSDYQDYLILHWEDGEVYGYYRWHRAFMGLTEDGILENTASVYPLGDTPEELAAAEKEYYDRYFYYMEFNGPECTEFYVAYDEYPYHAPEVTWSDFTPENIDLLVTAKAAETVRQYPRDMFNRDGVPENA